MEENYTKKRFLKIPLNEWRYELESGEISWDEHSLREWLWFKADLDTGKVIADCKVLEIELKRRFPRIKQLKNKINKLLLSLKKKRKLWFPEHTGKRGKIEIELQGFPLMSREYLDISHRFQAEVEQRIDKIHLQKDNSEAEALETKQRLERTNAQENQPSSSSEAEVPSSRESKQIKDKKDKIELTHLISTHPEINNTIQNEEKEKKEPEKNLMGLTFWSSEDVGYYFQKLIKEKTGMEPQINWERVSHKIGTFLEVYGPEEVPKIFNFYLESKECEKDRRELGFDLGVILSPYIINKWIASHSDEKK
jgi:hypothetical protein